MLVLVSLLSLYNENPCMLQDRECPTSDKPQLNPVNLLDIFVLYGSNRGVSGDMRRKSYIRDKLQQILAEKPFLKVSNILLFSCPLPLIKCCKIAKEPIK